MARRGSTQQRLTQLAGIGRALIQGSLEDRLKVVVELAPKALDLKSASIFLVQADFASFGDRLALPGVELIEEAPRPEGLTATVIRTGRLLAVEDVATHPGVNPRVLEAGIRSFIAVPLTSAAGRHGVLYLNQSEPRRFSDADLRLAEAIGDMVGQAVANARLLESEREARQALETERRHLASLTAALNRSLGEADLLRTIAVAVAGVPEVDRILQAVLDALRAAIDFGGGSILVLVDRQLAVSATAGQQSGRVAGQRIRRAAEPVWRVAETGEPANEISRGAAGAQALAAVPLRWRGEIFGVLELASSSGQPFGIPELNLLRKVADEIAGWVFLAALGQLPR